MSSMKLFRYRKPSVNRLLGITTEKRRIKHSLGISQAQAWTKPSRLKQRAKYKAGWYSPQMRIIRNTAKGRFPSPFGIFSSKRK